MADDKVTVSHPVTGSTREVTRSRADNLVGMGWQVTEPKPRRVAQPDEPDVEAGKAKLHASTGAKPEQLHVTKTAKKAAKRTARKHAASAAEASAVTKEDAAQQTEAPVPAAENAETLMARESEAGHGGLQVDHGASDA